MLLLAGSRQQPHTASPGCCWQQTTTSRLTHRACKIKPKKICTTVVSATLTLSARGEPVRCADAARIPACRILRHVAVSLRRQNAARIILRKPSEAETHQQVITKLETRDKKSPTTAAETSQNVPPFQRSNVPTFHRRPSDSWKRFLILSACEKR